MQTHWKLGLFIFYKFFVLKWFVFFSQSLFEKTEENVVLILGPETWI